MLKSGTFDQVVPAHTQLNIEGQNEFVVYELDDEKQPAVMLARSSNRHCKFTVRKHAILRFQIEGKKFLSIDARPVRSDHEEVSSIPYEIPDDNQANLSLEEKLKKYLAEIVAERYGEDSDAMDTFEDAQDLDWEDDDPIAAFEPQDVVEEEPDPPPGTEPPPAEPPPAEPPVEDPPPSA